MFNLNLYTWKNLKKIFFNFQIFKKNHTVFYNRHYKTLTDFEVASKKFEKNFLNFKPKHGFLKISIVNKKCKSLS